ncbi:unnamed protein product [Microthlaspi erraticum]|uniref:MULE transposase domain-containing protein n=1 Tax=Microthlaspi erraticum TaxID=1685480 RepID=A0A6D2K2F7_9BRAS|nr:unnamed protein product [Microthlaspi erraticum]
MVFEDFKVDRNIYEVELSYMFSKLMRLKLPQDTPPVSVGTSRQLHEFLNQQKTENARLCVEIKKKDVKTRSSLPKRKKIDDDLEENLADQEEDDDDDDDEDIGDIFDYCDDSVGASSDDENFTLYGKLPQPDEHVEEKKTPLEMNPTPVTKKAKGIPPTVKLELSSLTLTVGQQYETKDELEMRCKILSVLHHFDFNVDRSDPEMLVIKCWIEGCSWRVRATPVGDSTQFTIRKYVAEHTCSVTERSASARKATPNILGVLYKDFVGSVDSMVKPKHVSHAMNLRFGIKMDYSKAHRTLKEARKLVRGSAESGYAELPTYLHMIRRTNPGTLTRLEVDENQRFKYLFLAFGASINGFPYMRKVIVVDGTFLKEKYKGTLLTASAQDGNFQIFPIAFAVVDTENNKSWEWFFRQLSNVIPDDEGLAIISDRHKAIAKAIGKVYPMASRGVCTYHLYKNILQRFRGR